MYIYIYICTYINNIKAPTPPPGPHAPFHPQTRRRHRSTDPPGLSPCAACAGRPAAAAGPSPASTSGTPRRSGKSASVKGLPPSVHYWGDI